MFEYFDIRSFLVCYFIISLASLDLFIKKKNGGDKK